MARLLPPVVTLLVVGVLTVLNLNGSSLALLSPQWRQDVNLVAGDPQAIRSDEYEQSTPNLIGNDRRGLPVEPWIGLSPTFLPATSIGVVSAHWTEAFKPADWGFFVLPTSEAFALRWWATLAGGLLGVYALLLALTRSVLLSSGLAAAAVLTPYTAWWSNTPAGVVGWAAAATACVVMAMRSDRVSRAVLWALAAGYFAVAVFLVLYPPWQVPLAWVCIAVVLGTALDERVGWRRLLVVALGTTSVMAPALGLWFVQSREAIAATTHTYYPGSRLSPGGGGSLRWLLDTPSSLWLSNGSLGLEPLDVSATGGRLLTNASEVSAPWVPLPLLAAAVLGLGWVAWRRFRPVAEGAEPSTGFWTATLTTGSLLLLLAWALLPVPHVVGVVTGLDRVPGFRTPLAVGFAACLVLALVATGAARLRPPPAWLALLAVAGVATVVAAVWATTSLPWRGGGPDAVQVALAAASAATATAVLVSGRLTGPAAVAMGLVGLAVYAPVNPLYRGIGPAEDAPVVRALREHMGDGPAPRVAVYGEQRLVSLVTASGVVTLSGLTVYPDAEVWQRLAPEDERQWNNYSKYFWVADPSLTEADIPRNSGTRRQLHINPCAPQTLELRIDLSVSTTPLDLPCLSLLEVIPFGTRSAYLYETTTSTGS